MQTKKDFETPISIQAVRRLPQYLNYLKLLLEEGVERVSAPAVAKRMGLNEVQVRKDLAAVSESGGTPRTGFLVADLVRDISRYLGYDNVQDAVLVGAGHLGSALLSYEGFKDYGIRIVAAFDSNENCVGRREFGKAIYPVEKLPNLCRRLNIHIGIITVPGYCAQDVCELLVAGGIRAIWNFAPVHLTVPEGVVVQNENMAASLAILSKRAVATGVTTD